jgi:transposase
MGVDEIYRGKSDKFLTVVSNLETGEPLWFGKERKKETLDEFFRTQLRSGQRRRIEAACVDMWEPFRLSMEEWVPGCRIVHDKFHIIQHANDAVDEVRRAEFFRKGRKMREVVKGKKWLLLSRWKNLEPSQRGVLNRLFQLNRRVLKAYLLKESLEQLWDYRYEGAMLNYLRKWMDQLRWQRLPSFQKLAEMLLKHLDGILNYCRTKVRFGLVEAINGNIRMLINRGRGYKNMRYLLLKARRMVVTNTEYVAFQKIKRPRRMPPFTNSRAEPSLATGVNKARCLCRTSRVYRRFDRSFQIPVVKEFLPRMPAISRGMICVRAGETASLVYPEL